MREDDERMNELRMLGYNDDVVTLRNERSEINPLLFSPLRLSFDSLLLLETEGSFLHQTEVLETKES